MEALMKPYQIYKNEETQKLLTRVKNVFKPKKSNLLGDMKSTTQTAYSAYKYRKAYKKMPSYQKYSLAAVSGLFSSVVFYRMFFK
jgi:hypothetical protein